LQIFGLAIPRNQFPVGHVLPAYRTSKVGQTKWWGRRFRPMPLTL
jgi:hypothetical protein